MKNFASIKEEIEKIITPILEQNGLQVYDIVNYFDFESDVLQILVEDKQSPNKPLDFDDIVRSNEQISLALDDVAHLSNAYMLEVASAGVEKVIKNKASLIQAVDAYLHVEFIHPINKITVVEGYLTHYDAKNDTFQISYLIKGQKKKCIFNYEDIKTVRYAVKF